MNSLQSVWLSIHLSCVLSVCLTVCLSICLVFVCLFDCLSIHLSIICSSVCLSIVLHFVYYPFVCININQDEIDKLRKRNDRLLHFPPLSKVGYKTTQPVTKLKLYNKYLACRQLAQPVSHCLHSEQWI